MSINQLLSVIGIKLRKNLKWVVLVLVAIALNLIVVVLTYRQGIDIGDGATFYQFARNLVSGEVFYQDFIHFRTPASYGLYAGFVALLGDSFASLRFGMFFESRVLYPILFIIAFRIFFQGKYFWLLVAMVGLLFLLPEFAQLRTVLALLATAVLAKGLLYSKPVSIKTLIVSGVLCGLAFIFGQETGVIAGSLAAVTIMAVAIERKVGVLSTVKYYLYYGVGFLVGLLPLLVYVIIHNQVFNFLYYTLYYGFILQPKFMDLPFPEFNFAHSIYYIPFVIIIIASAVLFSIGDKKQKAVMGLYIAFVILRLITLVGRSDIGHLLFVVPELILLGLLAYIIPGDRKLKNISISRNLLIGIALLLTIFLWVVTGGPSAALILAAFIVVTLFIIEVPDKVYFSFDKVHGRAVVLLVTGLFLFLLVPNILGEVKQIKAAVTGSQSSQYKLDNSYVDKNTYELLESVKKAVDKRNPLTLFSYPIQPYFYRFAPSHATSFMTYEPQTTIDEQLKSVEQLKKNMPEVVLFDPAQATELSDSLWLINDYIMQNYSVTEVIQTNRIIWVMEPKTKSEYVPIVFTKEFKDISGAIAVQSPEKDINNGLLTLPNESISVSFSSISEIIFEYDSLNKGCLAITTYKASTKDEIEVCKVGTYIFTDDIDSITFENSTKNDLVIDNVLIKR